MICLSCKRKFRWELSANTYKKQSRIYSENCTIQIFDLLIIECIIDLLIFLLYLYLVGIKISI